MIFIICNTISLLQRVTIGSWQHILPIVFSVLFGVFIIRYSNRKLKDKQQESLFQILAIFVSATVAIFHIYLIRLGHYNLGTDLPLYLCSLLALLIPVFAFYRKYWMYEILLFWIIAGTAQGVITPDIPIGFPAFDYFRYWVVHLGLLIIIFYATVVFKMRPNFKSVFKSFFALQVYVLLMIAINFSLKANYFYLNQKPEATSLLDYFGEWPYYIVVGQLIIIPYFLLIYLPFYLVERKGKRI